MPLLPAILDTLTTTLTISSHTLGVLSVQISSKTEQKGMTAGQPHIIACFASSTSSS